MHGWADRRETHAQSGLRTEHLQPFESRLSKLTGQRGADHDTEAASSPGQDAAQDLVMWRCGWTGVFAERLLRFPWSQDAHANPQPEPLV